MSLHVSYIDGDSIILSFLCDSSVWRKLICVTLNKLWTYWASWWFWWMLHIYLASTEKVVKEITESILRNLICRYLFRWWNQLSEALFVWDKKHIIWEEMINRSLRNMLWQRCYATTCISTQHEDERMSYHCIETRSVRMWHKRRRRDIQRTALIQPSFSGLFVICAYFPNTILPPAVTSPSSETLTSITVPFVMTPSCVYIGDCGFFLTPKICSWKVALRSATRYLSKRVSSLNGLTHDV